MRKAGFLYREPKPFRDGQGAGAIGTRQHDGEFLTPIRPQLPLLPRQASMARPIRRKASSPTRWPNRSLTRLK